MEAAQELTKGKHRHDVLETAIRVIENDPTIDSVGWGGFPNLNGQMQLDGAFMDGNTRELGAVAALSNFTNPVSIARKLMEKGLHTMIAGADAEAFAREQGFSPSPDLLTQAQKETWEKNVRPLFENPQRPEMIELVRSLSAPKEKDTVVMIAGDHQGLSCATSTSGWPYKLPGRVGDAPICGGGFYVDSRRGGCVCTFTGEMAMRAGTARYVVAQLERGASPEEAVYAGFKDVHALRDGLIDALAIYAVSAEGNAFAAVTGMKEPVSYWYWKEGMTVPEKRIAQSLDAPVPT